MLLIVHWQFTPVTSSTAYAPVGNFPPVQPWDWVSPFVPPVQPWGWVSPFEPAKFSKEVKSCQEVCADKYYDCLVLECDEIQEKEHLFSIPTSGATKQTSSKWYQVLRFFSFGLLPKKSVKKDDVPEFSEKMRNRNSFKCFQGCRRTFHSCYKDCICDHAAKNDTFSLTKCYGNNAPMTNLPSLLTTIIFKPQEISPSAYSFDWGKVQ